MLILAKRINLVNKYLINKTIISIMIQDYY